MTKQDYLQGLNEGYTVGLRYEQLNIPLAKRLRYFFKRKALSDYEKGAKQGYELGVQELTKQALYKRRMAELEAQKAKEKERTTISSTHKSKER